MTAGVCATLSCAIAPAITETLTTGTSQELEPHTSGGRPATSSRQPSLRGQQWLLDARLLGVTEVLNRRPLMLELGCGPTKVNPDAVGVDLIDYPGVDVRGDALEVMCDLPDGSVSSIYSAHFLEHVDDVEELLREAARVLEPGGEFRAVIPHFSNPAFYSDPTHRTFFGLYTFAYWVRATPFTRTVPQYDEPLPFTLVSARHVFKSSRPFYIRHAIKKVLSGWVNLGRWTQEFYEEHLCWLMPCYEIDYRLKRD